MQAFFPYDLKEGFVDAVAMWSEFLKGDRSNKEWGVAAAASMLNDSGFGTFKEAIPSETLRKLRVLAAGAAEFQTASAKNTSRMAKFEALAREVSPFFERNCDVRLEPDLASGDFAPKDWLSADSDDLDAVTKVIKNEYDDPSKALDSVDISAKNLYDSVPADANNDYGVVPRELNSKDFPANEYDVVGRDLVDSPYFEPPPPEKYFEDIVP